MQLTFEKFTPSEVATITGVSADNQRNLRRAGYLPHNEGHARFELIEVAKLLVIGLMSERGIGPKVSTAFADTAARGILLKSLWISRVYSSDVAEMAHAATANEFAETVEMLRQQPEFKDKELDEPQLHGAMSQRYVAEKVEAMSGAQGEKAPEFFCLWANGYPEFFYGDEHPFEDHSYGLAAWQGPVVMLSMGALAAMIADRLPRPAIRLVEEAN